jgi:hypothetical protein
MAVSSTELPLDPIDLLEEVAHQQGWECDTDSHDVFLVKVPGDYAVHTIAVSWNNSSEMLIVRVSFPVYAVQPYLVQETYKLICLINQGSLYGSWYIDMADEDVHYLVWRLEIHTDIVSVTQDRMENMLQHCRDACDTFYPSFQMFLDAKPTFRKVGDELHLVRLGLTAEEALEYADGIHPVGTA